MDRKHQGGPGPTTARTGTDPVRSYYAIHRYISSRNGAYPWIMPDFRYVIPCFITSLCWLYPCIMTQLGYVP